MRLALVCVLLVAGCVTPPERPPAGGTTDAPPPLGPFTVASPAFRDMQPIPRKHACDGENVSPPLSVTGVPAEARSVALLVYDPDAPTPQVPTRNITHWVVWNLTPDAGAVVFPEGAVPEGAVQGASENGQARYMGPCPPQVSPAHRYVFLAFALDAPLDLEAGATRAEFERALDGRTVDVASLTGTYARALAR